MKRIISLCFPNSQVRINFDRPTGLTFLFLNLFQDLADDKKLGLKSTAIIFSESPRLWLSGFAASMISWFSLCGVMNAQTWPYYVSLLVISAHLAKQVRNSITIKLVFLHNQPLIKIEVMLLTVFIASYVADLLP